MPLAVCNLVSETLTKQNDGVRIFAPTAAQVSSVKSLEELQAKHARGTAAVTLQGLEAFMFTDQSS
jgi:hypothetical protein